MSLISIGYPNSSDNFDNDSLIISNGIHKDEIKEKGIEKVAKSYETICNYIQSELKW